MIIFRQFMVTLLLAALAGTAAAEEQAQPAAAPKAQYNQPSQAMGEALKQFGRTSGYTVMIDSRIARGLTAPSVRGTYTPVEALDLILASSGLQADYLGARTVAIRASRAAGSTSSLMPADQMRLASEVGGAAKVEQEPGEKDRQIVVKDTKVRPTANPNLDIPRTMEDVQPYQIYDSATIERSGVTTVEEFLKQRVTMNTISLTTDQGLGGGFRSGQSTGIGITSVDLRGLGPDLTLVLINGRRAGDRSSAAFSQKLNEIPTSMIERIEVLPTSSSGIYGGNALGGVVNIVLKRDYTGGTVGMRYDGSEDASDRNRNFNASYGWALEGGRTRMNVSLNWSDAEPMVLGDRANLYYESLARISANYPAFFATSSTAMPLGALTNIKTNASTADGLTFLDGTPLGSYATHVPAGLSASTSAADLRSALIANRGTWNTQLPDTAQSNGLRRALQAAQDNRSMGFNVQRQMLPWLDMAVDLHFNASSTHAFWTLPSTVLVLGEFVAPVYCPNFPTHPTCQPAPPSPLNPFRQSVSVALPIDYAIPLVSGGDTFIGTLTADAKLPFDWTAMLDYAHTRTTSASDLTSFDTTYLQSQINAGTFNPFVDPATLAGYDWSQYAYTDAQRIKGMTDQFSVRLGGPLAKLPWGTPRLNVLLDRSISTAPGYRRDLPIQPSNPVPSQPIFYNGGPGHDRQSINSSVYAETLVPLVRENSLPGVYALELQLAGRVSRSVADTDDGTGSVEYSSTNYTFGFSYRPVRQLMLRASRATAFLPPTIAQLTPPDLSLAPTFNFAALIDRMNGSSIPAGTVRTISGGNPDLKPQHSQSTNVGVVFQPDGRLTGLRMNMEYYRIDQQDSISTLSQQLLLDNEQYFSDRIVRDPVTGNVTQIRTAYLNLYKRSTKGMDYRVDYDKPVGGSFLGISASHTTIDALLTQDTLAQLMTDAVGHPSDGGAAQHKSNLSLSWERDHWSLTWDVMRYGSYKIYGAAGGPASMRATIPGLPVTPNTTINPQGGDTVPAQMVHDMTVGYAMEQGAAQAGMARMLDGMSLRLGVRNIFGTEPELDVSYPANYYRSPYIGTRLRSFWFTAQKSF